MKPIVTRAVYARAGRSIFGHGFARASRDTTALLTLRQLGTSQPRAGAYLLLHAGKQACRTILPGHVVKHQRIEWEF